jgi:hypothetical protein
MSSGIPCTSHVSAIYRTCTDHVPPPLLAWPWRPYALNGRPINFCVFTAPVIDFLNGAVTIVNKSMLTKSVPNHELGKSVVLNNFSNVRGGGKLRSNFPTEREWVYNFANTYARKSVISEQKSVILVLDGYRRQHFFFSRKPNFFVSQL